jgi:hypothetical protein
MTTTAEVYSKPLGRKVSVDFTEYPTEYAYDPDIMLESVDFGAMTLDAAHLSGWVTSDLEEQVREWLETERAEHQEAV